MTKRAKRIILLIGVLLAIVGFVPILAWCDAKRVARSAAPIFCWSRWVGREMQTLHGEYGYRGFGYDVWATEPTMIRLHDVVHCVPETAQVVFALPALQRFNYAIPRPHEPFVQIVCRMPAAPIDNTERWMSYAEQGFRLASRLRHETRYAVFGGPPEFVACVPARDAERVRAILTETIRNENLELSLPEIAAGPAE